MTKIKQGPEGPYENGDVEKTVEKIERDDPRPAPGHGRWGRRRESAGETK